MLLIGYDRLLDSDIRVPGAIPAGDGVRGPADLRITLSSSRLPASPAQPLYRLRGDTLIFSPPGVATYRCGAAGIEIDSASEADREKVAALLLATALPAALWMSGDFVFHASAVRLPGQRRAIAFAGASGSGKSSLAAALVRAGAALVGDDTLRLRAEGDEPVASGLAGGWFMRAAANEPRLFCDIPADRSLRRCALGAVFILGCSGAEAAPRRLDAVTAVEQLLANRHRPRIPAILRRNEDMLRFCSFLAGAVPVYIWQPGHGAFAGERSTFDMLASCVEDGDG